MTKRFPAFLFMLPLMLLGCSDNEDPQGLGQPYVVDLTMLPTTGEGTLTLQPATGDKELSGTFQVGPYSVDIRIKKEVARAAGVDIDEPYEGRAKVIIFRQDETSTGFHQIYELSAMERL